MEKRIRIINNNSLIVPYLAHKRIIGFWILSIMSLITPWLLKGCQSQTIANSVLEHCAVMSVHDGDTMTVGCDGSKIKVRLHCIDAPELAQGAWGRISRDNLRRLAGDEVRLSMRGVDRYGRSIGVVFAGDRNLNLEQISSGNAAVYTKYCQNDEYSRAEQLARKAMIGIWAEPGEQQTPWSWRHR